MTGIRVTGVLSYSSERFVKVKQDGNIAILPYEVFASSSSEIKSALAERGVMVVTPKTLAALLQDVEAISSWPSERVANRVGWNGSDVFVLPDGTVISPPDLPKVSPALVRDEAKCAESGKGKQWKRLVGARLAGQAIPTFALCFSFAPSLLALTQRNINLGFEVVGKAGTGKTTVQQLAASVWGSPSRNCGQPYMVTMHTTVSGLEQTMRDHADMPIIMDEANLFATETSEKSRGEAFRAIAFKLASGNEKNRYGKSANREAYRLGVLISANDPLSDLLQSDTDSAKAARERILTIPIGTSSEHGIFDRIPNGFANGADLASALLKAAERHHGHAGPRFVRHLVAERAKNEDRLRKEIANHIDQFRDAAGARRDSGSLVRITEAFGLIYAAGVLAQNFGCLPDSLDCLEAALHCYRLNRLHDTPPPPFPERLKALSKASGTIIWNSKHPNKVAKASVLAYSKGSHRELWIRPDAMRCHFPDWPSLRRDPLVRTVLIKEKGRQTTKRQAGRAMKPVRMYVFALRDE